MNENSLANLNPAKPGEVRNPNGRPKGQTRAHTIRNMLAVKITIDSDIEGVPATTTVTVKEAIEIKMARKAINGDVVAAAWLYDNAYGKQRPGGDGDGEGSGNNNVLDYSLLNDADLKIMAAMERKARGLPPIDEGEYISYTETTNEGKTEGDDTTPTTPKTG